MQDLLLLSLSRTLMRLSLVSGFLESAVLLHPHSSHCPRPVLEAEARRSSKMLEARGTAKSRDFGSDRHRHLLPVHRGLQAERLPKSFFRAALLRGSSISSSEASLAASPHRRLCRKGRAALTAGRWQLVRASAATLPPAWARWARRPLLLLKSM